MSGTSIARVVGRQVFDSRGRPTVEADVFLENGAFGQAIVPSGASTGRHEAHELRDGPPGEFEGRGVRRAAGNVSGELNGLLAGRDAFDQSDVDAAMLAADGTANLSRLGANAVLSVSLAVARAAADARRMPLYRYLAGLDPRLVPSLPLPMANILSGGAHAGESMDFQDFLAVPIGARTIEEAIAIIARVRSAAGEEMADEGLSVLLADEGGLSPGYSHASQALDLMMRAFRRAGLNAGDDVAIALDVAACELFDNGSYHLRREGRSLDGGEMVQLLVDLCRRYPIVSVEDPLADEDWDAWRNITAALSPIQVVGDDLFVTSAARIEEGAARGAANAVLIKLNQNGTLTGTLEAMVVARARGYATIVSARSGETEDAFISDLAVATGAGQIKIGSLRNSERLAKYNQLLRIAEDSDLTFAGKGALA